MLGHFRRKPARAKSFTRIILSGLIQHNARFVLIFDMHNEYGFDDTASDTGKSVVGLRPSSPGGRVVCRGTRHHHPQARARFPPGDHWSPISSQPEDIEPLFTRELNL